jgi:hypothetical protein
VRYATVKLAYLVLFFLATARKLVIQPDFRKELKKKIRLIPSGRRARGPGQGVQVKVSERAAKKCGSAACVELALNNPFYARCLENPSKTAAFCPPAVPSGASAVHPLPPANHPLPPADEWLPPAIHPLPSGNHPLPSADEWLPPATNGCRPPFIRCPPPMNGGRQRMNGGSPAKSGGASQIPGGTPNSPGAAWNFDGVAGNFDGVAGNFDGGTPAREAGRAARFAGDSETGGGTARFGYLRPLARRRTRPTTLRASLMPSAEVIAK